MVAFLYSLSGLTLTILFCSIVALVFKRQALAEPLRIRGRGADAEPPTLDGGHKFRDTILLDNAGMLARKEKPRREGGAKIPGRIPNGIRACPGS